ncbi:MAG TPA: TolC family protein, partial [Flavisolibacter sp.]
MKSRILVVAAIFMAALSGNAQNRILTLNEAIATSLQNNYDIQLFRNDSSLAALDYAFANYALLPRLSANGGSTFNNNNQKQVLADGTKRESNGIRSNNLAATLNLDWTLFDGFRMFIARNRLGKLVELGELQVKGQVVTTVAEVMRIYYDIIRQEQQLRALEEQMELNEERLKIAQYKFDIGTGAKPDVLQAQIDLNAQRSAALTQQTAINKIKEQLNALLVLPVETDFEVADSTIDFNADLTLDSIRSDIKNVNP